jgi:TonB family protein
MKRLLCWMALFPLVAGAQNPQATAVHPPPPPRITIPEIVRKVEPAYTAEARAAGIQGTVSLYVNVRADGGAGDIRVLHGLGLGLDAAAVEAVKQWQFEPATRGGLPIAMGRSAAVDFHLDAAGPWRIRMAAYHVVPRKNKTEMYEKPVLTAYVPPDAAACRVDGTSIIVHLPIGADGRPGAVTPADSPAAAAIAHWRWQPGTADGARRESNVEIEFECGQAPGATPGVTEEVQHVGGSVTPPVPIYKPEPQYSEEARKMKAQGQTTLHVIIDSTGHTRDIAVIAPLGLGLDENAVEAVTTWRFQPGMKDGQPVTVQAMISVNFQLL